MTKVLAFYLPQFHPIPENDKWYGKGFTEWTNVAKARPLFKGHVQPHIPSELGFYDLRNVDVMRKQAEMAKKYGVDGFCFWHYWFGNGKRLLETPFKLLVENKDIDISFSLAWANETWEKKLWDKSKNNQIIAKQEYPGIKDYEEHFYALLDAFKDPRYTRIDDKLFFVIYRPLDFPDVKEMLTLWRELAKKEKIDDFYFVAKDFDCRNKEEILNMGFDGIYNDTLLNIHHHLSVPQKIKLKIQRDYFGMPTIFKYRDAIKYMVTKDDYDENIIPLVAPNWDHSPRSGKKSIILTDAKPKYFEKVFDDAYKSINRKKEKNKIILIRAWNEWGEGNYLEPDVEYGDGYLKAISNVRSKYEK